MSEVTAEQSSFPPKTKNIAVPAEAFLIAANDASAQARNMWLFFIGILTYLIVTIAGTTHTDLLLNNPITLPFLDVKIPLFSFFLYAPAVILATSSSE